MLHTPLTLEATEDGTTVTITDESNVEYSYTVNSGTAVTKSSNASFTLNAGDIVQFNSTNPALGNNPSPSDPTDFKALSIIVDKKSYVYGNVMSMVNDGTEGFANDVTLADYAMPRLFGGNYSASNHIAFLADKPLMLPATTISKYCYGGMFSYCQDLTVIEIGAGDILTRTRREVEHLVDYLVDVRCRFGERELHLEVCERNLRGAERLHGIDHKRTDAIFRDAVAFAGDGGSKV